MNTSKPKNLQMPFIVSAGGYAAYMRAISARMSDVNKQKWSGLSLDARATHRSEGDQMHARPAFTDKPDWFDVVLGMVIGCGLTLAIPEIVRLWL